MSRRLAVMRAALLAASVVCVLVLAGLTVAYLSRASSLDDILSSFWWDAWFGFAVVGGMLVLRRPDEAVGRLLTLIAFFAVITFVGAGYSSHDFSSDRGLSALGTVAAVLYSPAFAAAFACTSGLVLSFPSGRLDSRLRRFGGRVIVTAAVLAAVGYLLRSRAQIGEGKWVANPLHPAFLGTLPDTAVKIGVAGLFASGLISFTAAVLTFRRSRGDERQQMRWFARSALIIPVLFVVGIAVQFAAGDSASNWIIFVALVGGLNAIATAIGIAVLRHRLYDIDRVVSRTASYAVVTACVVGGYVGLVALIESVLGFSSSVAVAASTLTAAAAFQPLRRRVQRTIDRRFDRAAYDARRTVDAFAARLRDQVDVDAVRTDLLATVSSSLAPTAVSVWRAP